MGPAKRRIALVVAATAALGLSAAPAEACRVAPGVICEETGNVSVPGNSEATQSTDTVPAKATEADALLEPLSQSELQAFDGLYAGIVEQVPDLGHVKSTFVKRVITCAVLAAGSATVISPPGLGLPSSQQDFSDAYTAVLDICLNLVLTSAKAPAPPARDASAARCPLVSESVRVQIARSGSRYRVRMGGKTFRPTHRPPLIVSCRRKGNGVLISVRARRHRRLRKLLGPKFSLAFVNPTSSPVTVRSTFSFK